MIWFAVICLIAKFTVIYAVPSMANCGKTAGCMIEPFDCVTNCDYLYKWVENTTSGNTNFEISVRLSGTIENRWIGIGFSKDDLMGDDNNILCSYSAANNLRVIQHSYSAAKEEPVVLSASQPQVGLTNMEVVVDGNYLTCKFTRAKKMAGITNYFDLTNKFYALAAWGSIKFTAGKPAIQPHDWDARMYSYESINFALNNIYFGNIDK